MHKFIAQLRIIWDEMTGVFDSRQKAIDFLKTMSLVIPLTLLIWISAERSQIVYDYKLDFEIDLRSSNGTQSAELLEYPEGIAKVFATLSGPYSRLEEIKNNINELNGRVSIAIPSSQTNGDPSLIVSNLLLDSPMFNGVNFVTVTPSQVKVRVEPYDKRTVKVVMEKIPVTYENVVPFPDRVEVRGPTSVLDKLFAKTGSVVYTAMDPQMLDTLYSPGSKEFSSVNLRIDDTQLSQGQRDLVSINPRQLTSLRFDVATEQSKSEKLRNVRIRMDKSLSIEKQFVVTCNKEILQNVQIKGPSDVIDRLVRLQDDPDPRLKDKKVVAQLTVMDEDRNKQGILRKPTIVNLPPNVFVDGPIDDIEFSVTDRSNPG